MGLPRKKRRSKRLAVPAIGRGSKRRSVPAIGRPSWKLVGLAGIAGVAATGVVERDDHPDVVDRRVRDGLDRAVGQRAAAEEPDVARGRGGEGVCEGEGRIGHGAGVA